jgi:hypothetical protein
VFAGTPALPAYRYWIRTLRRRHPDLVWSIAAGALGAVVAILVALSMY